MGLVGTILLKNDDLVNYEENEVRLYDGKIYLQCLEEDYELP
ncbi:8035_t:CDS:2, partial [Dentiscutata erythropus]